MKKNILLMAFCSFVFADNSFGSPYDRPQNIFPTVANYLSGEKVCEEYKDQKQHENVFGYVEVPINYKNPTLKTKIYFFLEEKFDPTKETIIYFKGGPGGSHHRSTPYATLLSFKYNVINFDQRGVKCSRPSNFKLYTSTEFYSSENTARDANELRKHFKVDKATVFGNSYGTVPATIFASIFPNHTKSIVLEGTVNAGDTLWKADHFWKLFQRWLTSLSNDDLNFIEKIPTNYGVSDTWFTGSARQLFYEENALSNLDVFLQNLKEHPNELIDPFSENLESNFEDDLLKSDDFLGSHEYNVYYHLACKEFSKSNPNFDVAFAVVDGKLVGRGNPEFNVCKYLGVKENKNNIYYSKNYPIKAPVTYFQGTTDGATTADEAVFHFKSVPKGFKQIYFRKNGGHGPLTKLLITNSSLGAEVFQTAVDGSRPTEELMDKIKKQEWVYSSGKKDK